MTPLVLIVDDDPNIREILRIALERQGFRTDEAPDGAAALTAAAKLAPDLIVLDIGLPEMSGFDLCTKIRSTAGHANVPILFLTGLTSFQNRAKSALIGGNDFICKPFDPLELGLKVQLWIHLCRTGRK